VECNFTPARAGWRSRLPASRFGGDAETRSRGFWVSGLCGGKKEGRRPERKGALREGGRGLGCVYIELWGPRRRGGWFRLFGPVTGPVADTRTQPSKSRRGPGQGRRVSDVTTFQCRAWLGAPRGAAGLSSHPAGLVHLSGHGFVYPSHVICEWIWIPNFGS